MNSFWFYVGLYISGVFISAVAQMMLKKSSSKKALYNVFTLAETHAPKLYARFEKSSNKLLKLVRKFKKLLAEYLNPFTILAYMIFVVATFLTIFSYDEVPLSMAPILGATEYFFVAALSRIFLKEKLTLKKAIGLAVIVLGILVYSSEKIFIGLCCGSDAASSLLTIAVQSML